MAMKIIAQNKKAFFDYDVIDSLEAGIVLSGDEVKSIRAGHVNLVGSFATFHKGELFLLNCHVTQYEKAYVKNDDDTKRTRKLLVKKRELRKLVGDVSCKGITLIPLKLYFNERGLVKVHLGLCKHRNAAGKKNLLKERDIKRETDKELKGYR